MTQQIELIIKLKETTQSVADIIMQKMIKSLNPDELDLISEAKLSQVFLEINVDR